MGLHTAQIPLAKLASGKQMRNVCIHHVGGWTSASLTANRRKSVLRKHRLGLRPDGDGVHCIHHCKQWKSIGQSGGVKKSGQTRATCGILVVVRDHTTS